MTRRLTAALSAALLVFFIAAPARTAPNQDAATTPQLDPDLSRKLASIAGEAVMDGKPYQYLEELSDDIGGRVTGSPAAAQAIAWGAETMKSIGLENVHTEPWQISRGWTRISASAEMLSPAHHRMTVDALGWVGSTPEGGAEADIVTVNVYQLADEVKNNSANWAGKVILVT